LAWAASDHSPIAERTPEPTSIAGSEIARGTDALALAAVGRGRFPQAEATPPADATDAAPDPDRSGPHTALKPVAGDRMPPALESPIARALRMVDDCQARYDRIRDYVCTFHKRERIDGRLSAPHVMFMKARTRPRSVYLKFRQPAAGREAIYIEGRHDGKVLAHDVGLGRLIAGTLHLDPNGPRAMEDNRHPITEAGIGPLLDTLEARWSAELDSAESQVEFRDAKLVDSRPCQLIQVTHTRRSPDFLFYQVQVSIDRELGLPIRFEAYDWPEDPSTAPALLEEYRYADLKLDVGLSDLDFDVSNEDYAFGRF
jgi:hypothetical protein